MILILLVLMGASNPLQALFGTLARATGLAVYELFQR
jgi:hypothetical protein